MSGLLCEELGDECGCSQMGKGMTGRRWGQRRNGQPNQGKRGLGGLRQGKVFGFYSGWDGNQWMVVSIVVTCFGLS